MLFSTSVFCCSLAAVLCVFAVMAHPKFILIYGFLYCMVCEVNLVSGAECTISAFNGRFKIAAKLLVRGAKCTISGFLGFLHFWITSAIAWLKN